MKKNNLPSYEIISLTLGELIVSALTVLGYFIFGLVTERGVDYPRVLLGVLLGSVVTILNYLFMIISLNRAVNHYLELRGSREMDDEEAERFAQENQAEVQNSVKLSFIVRTVSMLVTLIVAFVIEIFAPVATVVPLLAFRPIITLSEWVRSRIIKPDGIELHAAEREAS